MGSDQSTEKTKEELQDILTKTNKITETSLFTKKTNMVLVFSFEEGFFKTFFKKKNIKCKKFVIQNQTRSLIRHISLNVTQFYNFYNCLIASTQIFYNDKLKDKFSTRKSFIENENDICPICEETKVSIMLECYHFFCEKCIKVWLFDKKSSCPMCRYEINLNNMTHDIVKSKHWDILDKVNQKEFDIDTENRFHNVMNHLFK